MVFPLSAWSPRRRTQRLAGIAVVAAFVLALHLCAVPADAQALTADAVSKIKDAVVLIDVTLSTPDGEMGGSGSGFVISPNGHIVTNAHVVAMVTEDALGGTLVADDRTVQVVFHPGTAQEEVYPRPGLARTPRHRPRTARD